MTRPLQVTVSVPRQNTVDRLRHPPKKGLEAEKERLRKATKEFEAFFMYQMIKTMRQTTLSPEKENSTGLSGDLGKDEFTQMFDMEVTRQMVRGERNSVADMLYRSLVKQIEARHQSEDIRPDIKPIDGQKESIPIPDRQKLLPVNPANRLKTIERPEKHMPLQSRVSKIGTKTGTEPFESFIFESARETGIDSALIEAVIQVESGGDPRAVSPRGAKGLMQLTDSTATELGVTDSFDPKENIRGGSRYLRRLIDRFGDLKLALAAYNAGPGNVSRYGGVPPFAETERYIEKVMAGLNGK